MNVKTKKIFLWFFGTFFSVFLILIIAVWLKFQFISEFTLRAAGFTDATVEGARFTPSGSFFENIRLNAGGADVTIGRIEAYATLGDALDRRLTKVVIENVMVGLPARDDTEKKDGFSAVKLPQPLDLHVREAVLRNIRTFVPVAEGLPVIFSGSLIDRGDTYQLTGDYQVTGDTLKAEGQIALKAEKKTAALSAHIDIGEVRLELTSPAVSLRRGAGWLSLDITPAALAMQEWPVIKAQLSAGALKAFDLPLQGVNLTAAIDSAKSEIILQAQGMDNSAEITADLRLDRSDAARDKLKLEASAKLQNLDAFGVKDLKGRGQAQVNIVAAKARSDDWMTWQEVNGGLTLAAQKLSLPGLLRDVEAEAIFGLVYDTEKQTVSLVADSKPVSVKGVILPIDSKPVSLALPVTKNNPPALKWQAPDKKLSAHFSGLDLTTPQGVIKGAAAGLEMVFAAEYPAVQATFSAAEITHTAKPPAFVPVRLNGTAASVAGGGGRIGFTADLTEKNGLLTVNIKGHHDLAGQKGQLDLAMPQTTMRTGVYTLKDIFPLSASYVQDVTGTLGMSAVFNWHKAKSSWQTSSRGEVFLRDMTGNVEGNIINGVSGVIAFDSLMPLTLTRQRLAVGGVNVGLPLTAGIVVVSLDAKNNFTLHEADWTLAGGKITSTPFSLNLNDLTVENITLTAKDLQLSELFKIAPMDGLTADGTVDGTLPLRLQSGEISITNGVLESKGSGNIRYSPQDMPAFMRDSSQKQMVDLQIALRAFEFESLRLTLDGTLGRNQKIGISVKGKNPEFYGGYPVSLNLNVEGPLENILKYSPGSSQIPDSIRHQLEEYEKNNAKK